MQRVVIIGGGISGLSLAYRLQQASPGTEVRVLDRADHCGGTVWTIAENGFRLEAGPNGFLDTKPSTLKLCRDLGLADRLVAGSEAASKNRYLFLGGSLKKLPTGPGSFFTSDLLSWRGKWALLTERFRAPRRESGDETIDAFAKRRVGPEAAETLADALVTGIHAGDPTLLSIQATFPRMVEMEQQHGSVMKGFMAAAKQRRAEAKAKGEVYQRPGKLWSFPEGLQVLIDTLRSRLKVPPDTGVTVASIAPAANPPGWVAVGSDGRSWPADAVVLASPAYEQGPMLRQVDPELAERIGSIPYNRVAVLGLGFRRGDVPFPVDGFGFLAPQRLRGDLLGVQWCSAIFPGRAPEGMVLMRAMCGGWNRGEILDWDDDRLLAAVRKGLEQAMGITAPPAFHRLIRWDRAIPQYHLGHLDRVAWIEERLGRHPGLFVTGNAYRGIAINDCTERAEIVAAEVARFLAARGQPG